METADAVAEWIVCFTNQSSPEITPGDFPILCTTIHVRKTCLNVLFQGRALQKKKPYIRDLRCTWLRLEISNYLPLTPPEIHRYHNWCFGKCIWGFIFWCHFGYQFFKFQEEYFFPIVSPWKFITLNQQHHCWSPGALWTRAWWRTGESPAVCSHGKRNLAGLSCWKLFKDQFRIQFSVESPKVNRFLKSLYKSGAKFLNYS